MKKNKISKWEITSDLFINWLIDNDIKKFFLTNIRFRTFSLWWITDLANRDNVVKNEWFYNLKKILIDNKVVKLSRINLFFIIFLKFIKNLIANLFYLLLIKILIRKKKNFKNYENCFHSFEPDFQIYKKNNYIDRQYGIAPLKKNIEKNFFLITLVNKKEFFLNFFEKKKNLENQKVDYFIADRYLNFWDIISVYSNSVVYLFKIIRFIKKKDKRFYIDNKNCFNALYPLLLSSFAGNIQSYILLSLAIKNFFDDAKAKNFINYGEFGPGYKSIYFFLKKLKFPIKIITIQHSYTNKNILFFRNSKKEYNLKLNKSYISPMPDKYLVMGNHFKKILKEFFPNEIKVIGGLKYDIDYFKLRKKKKKVRKNNFKILICPTIGDENSLISVINESKLNNVSFILSPHPNNFEDTLEKFKRNFKHSFTYNKKKSSIEQLQSADLTVSGYSSLVLESVIYGIPAFRVISSEHPFSFDLRDGIDFAIGHHDFEQTFYKLLKKKLNNTSKITTNIFFKLDKKAYKRFWNNIQ